MVCSICSSTPSIRGRVDADIVRRLSLREIAARYKMSVRSVQRHLKHLPELLEAEPSVTTTPAFVVVAPTTNNITLNVFVVDSDAEERIAVGEVGACGQCEEEGGYR